MRRLVPLHEWGRILRAPGCPGELAKQPDFGHFPVAQYRFRRDLKELGRFFHAEAAKKSQLHHTFFTGIDLR